MAPRNVTISNAQVTTPDGTVLKAHRVVLRAGQLTIRERRGAEVLSLAVTSWERDRRRIHTFQTEQGPLIVRPTTCGTCGG